MFINDRVITLVITSSLMIFLSCCSSGNSATRSTSAVPKILLLPEMILNEEGRGDATLLMDEQELAGDPLNGSTGTPTTVWRPGWSAADYPAHVLIDLGAVYSLTTICLFDANSTGEITVSAGKPFEWTLLFTDGMSNYLKWNRHTVNVQTRYIRLTLTNPTSTPEIVLYGLKVKESETISAHVRDSVKLVQPSMENFIGINSFIDVPLEVEKVAGFIREYHNWRWSEGKEQHTIKHNPSYPGWNFDSYYIDRKSALLIVSPCIQGSVEWLSEEKENKPVKKGNDTQDPSSYRAHGEFMFQYAARYGNRAIREDQLELAEGQPKLSGLNAITYFEDWNEQDKTWMGKDAQFSPYEYAAMASADYDGHQKKMGSSVGIKNADPDAKLVMGGLAGLKIEYIKAMKVWADYHRAGSFPADVLNFHHYSREGKENNSVGISPEQDKLKEKMQALVAYRNTYLPDKEIWLTEFGYDVHPESPQRAPAIGAYSAQEVQAQWLVRSYLELAASGIDRAAMYMVRDHDSKSAGKYATSGLVTDKQSGHKPRTSWYYVYTLKNTLSGTKFVSEVPSGNSLVRIYKFSDAKTNKTVFALWCPTSDETIINNYQLALENGYKSIKLITMVDRDIDGIEKELIIDTKGRATVSVSERPVFVVVTN